MKDLKDLSALQLNTRNAVKGGSSSSSKRTKWNVPITDFARLTHNPIRAIVEGLKIAPNPDKPLIALSIGSARVEFLKKVNPTTFGNLKPAPEVIDALRSVARQAVADYVSHQGDVTANDVILCSGASCALDLCLSVLAGPGQNILIPRPGFSIYRTLAEGFGVECRYYDFDAGQELEVDL
ncbi:tyrosine aminotransferase-like, partial [Aedes aegypti]|uniref:Aminotransferase class I/classII large domain-containing protein n=1 Tax=Aedes aegypti TaxID=7159 RepID=A0A903VEE6_AEDAE